MNPAFHTPLMMHPNAASKSMGLSFDFSAVATIDTDITEELLLTNVMDCIQGMYVDNSANANAISFTFRTPLTAGYKTSVPAHAQAWLPVLVPKGKVFFTSATGLGVIVAVNLVNFPVAPVIWPSATVANVNANLTPILGAFVDRSGVASGGDDIVAAANVARLRIIIQNLSVNGNSMYIAFGAGATALTGLEIMPGGTFDSGAGPVSNQAIHLLGTAGQHYVAKEM